MDYDNGGLSSSDRQRRTAAEIARRRVLAAYSSTVQNLKNLPNNSRSAQINSANPSRPGIYSTPEQPTATYQSPLNETAYGRANQQIHPEQSFNQISSNNQTFQSQTATTASPYQSIPTTPTASYSSFKDAPINTSATNEEWKQYHSAWQDYYKNYYNDYYSKAAQTYLATEKMKNERAASGKLRKARNLRRAIPAVIIILIILTGLFLQYNRLIFAPIMAYIVPNDQSANTTITPVDPSVSQSVSADPRLIIPKLNVDVPVAFSINPDDVMEAMNYGVAQFSIPGANALPGQIGNLVISGHSAGDIYSNNQYKFIFSGLERLVPGDLIYINYDSVRYTYQVTGDETVEPTDVAALVYDTDKPILTLITCTPLGTSRYRLLVSAEQISPSYNDADTANNSDSSTSNDFTMPANSPSFFEQIFGN